MKRDGSTTRNRSDTQPASARPAVRPPGIKNHATITAFHGSKGGVGTTTLAAETAAALAAAGRHVVAVDLDLYRGDLHYRFDIPVSRGTHTLIDLVPVLDEIEARILDNALSRCSCRVRLLPVPASSEEADIVQPDHVHRLLTGLASEFDHVIIDTPSHLDGITAAALEEADLMVLVVTPEIASLGGARRLREALARRGGWNAREALVVNRALGDSDLLSVADVESFLDIPVALVLPEETARCRRLADEGHLLTAERSPLSQGILAMVRRLFPGVISRCG